MKLTKQNAQDLREVVNYDFDAELKHAAESVGNGLLLKPIEGVDPEFWQNLHDLVERNVTDHKEGEAAEAQLEGLLLSSQGHVACALLRLRWRMACEPEAKAPKYEPGGLRIIARVVLQEWDDGFARDVTEIEVDVTESILNSTWHDLNGLSDGDATSDFLPCVQQRLRDEGHVGPFHVYVTEAVDDYLETFGLPELDLEEPSDKWDAHRKSRQLKTNA